jgi:hypothetical protein
MIRAQWRTPQFDLERHYGLGIASSKVGDWDTFGHGGGFQGFISVTMAMPERGLVLAVLTNSSDGLAGPWATGIIHILRGFARHGSPAPRLRDWTGAVVGLWGALDIRDIGEAAAIELVRESGGPQQLPGGAGERFASMRAASACRAPNPARCDTFDWPLPKYQPRSSRSAQSCLRPVAAAAPHPL